MDFTQTLLSQGQSVNHGGIDTCLNIFSFGLLIIFQVLFFMRLPKFAYRIIPLVFVSLIVIGLLGSPVKVLAENQKKVPSIPIKTEISKNEKIINSQNSNFLKESFEEHSLAWLFISSVLGGIVGASFKFLFEVILPYDFQKRREAIVIKRKYSTPLLLAAEALRNRLENMIKFIDRIEAEGWLSRDELSNPYYLLSTLYVVGILFGWVEILRRTVVYLDMANVKETKKFELFLEAIEAGFSAPGLLGELDARVSGDRWVYSYVLQAIAEKLIIKPSENANDYRTVGFGSFQQLLDNSQDQALQQWLESLKQMFRDLKKADVRFKRIVAIHAILCAFIDDNDPQHIRTEAKKAYWDYLTAQEQKILKERLNKIVG